MKYLFVHDYTNEHTNKVYEISEVEYVRLMGVGGNIPVGEIAGGTERVRNNIEAFWKSLQERTPIKEGDIDSITWRADHPGTLHSSIGYPWGDFAQGDED